MRSGMCKRPEKCLLRCGRISCCVVFVLFGLFVLPLVGESDDVPLAEQVVPGVSTKHPPLRVRLTGVDNDKTLAEDLKKVSRALRDQIRPGASTRQIRWQAEQDRTAMREVLESHARFDGKVTVQFDTAVTPPELVFAVTPGIIYRMRKVTVVLEDGTRDEHRPAKLEDQHPPARASVILQLEDNIVSRFRNRGYPFAEKSGRRLRFFRDRGRVDLEFDLLRGEKARHGPLQIRGLDRVDPEVIHRMVPWKEGDRFDEEGVNRLRRELLGSGLFSTVRCEYDPEVTAGGLLPVRVLLTERKHRTVRLGLEYSSDTGAGAIARWEHRNVGGNGDRFYVNAEVTEIGEEGSLHFERKKLKAFPKIGLEVSVEIGDEETDAFDNFATEERVLFAYHLRKDVRLVSGFGYRNTEVEQLSMTNNYELLLFPLMCSWDRRDNLLDPKKGFYTFASILWHKDTQSDLAFSTTTLAGAVYHSPKAVPRLTLALKLEASDIQGATRDNVPADSRLYAGGAASVRGYEYQSIGSRVEDTPIGGTRRFTGAVELRYRSKGNLGAVLFSDAGSVSVGEPEDNNLRYSVGAGLRYYTEMGPLRVDVAFPLERREGIDDAVQLYVSIGQYF